MDETNGSDLTPNHVIQKAIDNLANELTYKTYDFNITQKFEKGENYMGEIKRATLKGTKNDGEKEVLHLILKTPPPGEYFRSQMRLNSIYAREIYAYTTFLPTLKSLQVGHNVAKESILNYANCYAHSSNDLCEILVLEDLNAKGYKMFDRLKPLDYEHIMLTVTTLSKFHATSFAAKEKLPKDTYEDFKSHSLHVNDMGENFEKSLSIMWSTAVQYIRDTEAKKKLEKYGENLLENFNWCLNLSEAGDNGRYNIITHGDSWINNMLFKYEEGKPKEIILVDWQLSKYCSPVPDLMYFLWTCTDEDIRTKLWDEILETYYNVLEQHLKTMDCDAEHCYPKKEFQRDIEDFGIYGLVTAILLAPLILNKREDSFSASDVVTEDGFDSSKINISDKCIERLNGAVRHAIKLNII